jgi:hypothetical protein
VAVALTTTLLPLTVAPFAGAVRATVGGLFVTVTDRAAEVVALALVSVAFAVIDAAPLGVAVEFHVMEYGEVVSVPTRVEPTKNSTFATAMLSAAVALMATFPPTVAPSAGAVRLTVGGVTSAFWTVAELAADVVALPFVSVALAVIEIGPSATVVEFQVIE